MASAKILDQKKQVVSDLIEKLKSATAGVLVDYCGLTVEQDTLLRSELRKAGVDYKVVKNTLMKFAGKETGLSDLDPILEGPTSLAVSFTDPVAAAKIIAEFAEKFEALEIKAGFVEGRVLSVDEVKRLAKLPSREVLISQVLAGFNAPISGFANVLNANIRGLVVALNQIAEKQSA